MEYLTLTGLQYFTSKFKTWIGTNYYSSSAVDTLLSDKVDKVSGKGLSTNDFTTALLNKLNGIEAGAEVNTIETIKVNGTTQTITSKTVDIDLSGYATTSSVTAVSNRVSTIEADYLKSTDVTAITNAEIDALFA